MEESNKGGTYPSWIGEEEEEEEEEEVEVEEKKCHFIH
jgi:hypothetical protein